MLPKITTVLRSDRQREGKSQIAIQVRYKNQRKQEFTGLYIHEDNFKDGIVSGIKNADWYNAKIKKKISELEANYLRNELTGQPVTIATKTASRKSFIDYANSFYDNLTSCTEAYRLRSKASIKHLEDFAGDLPFEKVTPQLLKDFENSLTLTRNTKNKIFKRIKQPCKMAIKEELINKDPFAIYTPPTYKQPKRDFLTMEEIEAIEGIAISDSKANIRAYFLLSCYTGLRYSDLAVFDTKKHIITSKGVQRIVIGTTKTKEVVSIKVSEKVQRIIESITAPIPSNVHCNRMLREIIAAAEINRHTNWHMGRHSFAVNSAILGIPIEAVAKLLGHNSIRTTEIYYKIVDTKIDEYMDRWG